MSQLPRTAHSLSLATAALALLLPGAWATAGERVRPVTRATITHLVPRYLATLTPLSSTISTTRKALRKLGPSASNAQVDRVVAPLRTVLAPLQALLASSTPPTTLEALGAPVKDGCVPRYGYRTVAQGAHLDVGGKLYDNTNGFQVKASCSSYSLLAWQLHGAYKSLSARIGEDALNYGKAVTLSFRDATNTAIPFSYRTKLLFSLIIPFGALAPVTVSIAHESGITIVLSGGTKGGVVDVVNDRLS